MVKNKGSSSFVECSIDYKFANRRIVFAEGLEVRFELRNVLAESFFFCGFVRAQGVV